MDTRSFQPLGVFNSPKIHTYDASRQAKEKPTSSLQGTSKIYEPDYEWNTAQCQYIELASGFNFEQALEGLVPGDRIWILFLFHLNLHWKPMVQPPRGRRKKIGLFATRSPYRPNGIGMSTVVIQKIEKLKIFVSNCDILHRSPVLDIKPYLAYADSFPEAQPEWLKNSTSNPFRIEYSRLAAFQLKYLSIIPLSEFIENQLEFDPEDRTRKRLLFNQQSQTSSVITLCYRTWRIDFLVLAEKKVVQILEIRSGYTENDLQNSMDPYNDKVLHREFLKKGRLLVE